MFEILLTACLASDLANCRTERLPGGETLAECRAAARIGAAGFPPHLEVQSFPCTLAGEEPAFSISQIAPGIFVHKGQHAIPDRQNLGDVSNMGFIIGRDGVMVVDSGSTRKIGDRLLAAIRQETDLPVTHVVLTHAHPDHIYGTGGLLIDAPLVIGHERHKEALQSRGDAYREAMSRMLGDGFEGSVGVAPGRLIDAVSEIDLGDRIVELRPHRTSH
ncbi:MAG: MBL fold metallo-hydrolase, partial [Pseudomonadota bacterium]